MHMDRINIKVNQSGDIVIPAEIVKRIGIEKDEDGELQIIGDTLILRQKDKTLDVNEILKILVTEGEIELTEFTVNKEGTEDVPTLEELHQSLAKTSVPIEDIIRNERKKRDDILRS